MKATVVALLLVLAAACGSAQAGPQTSPPAQATAKPTDLASPSAVASPSAGPQPLLFAVLEAKGTANAGTYNTVAIAGLDGHARAKTTFTPMPNPNLGCIDAVLPQSAHVAAGKVFYADAKGVVRSLAMDGTITTVTTFPMTSTQQMLSFAVSPDGSRVLGTILTISGNASMACDSSPSTATYTFDAYSAASGQTAQVVYHQASTQPPKVLALTGWDALGPIGTYPTVWATQGGGPGSTLGTLVRVDPATVRAIAPFGDPTTCGVWDSVPSGAFVCMKGGVATSTDPYGPIAVPVSVRDAAGQEEWHFTQTEVNGASSPYLSPDEQHVVICCHFDTISETVVDRQGHQTLLKTGFFASGWLDASTIFGLSEQNNNTPQGVLSYVALNDPGTFVSMGFSGLIVGTVRN